MKTQPSEAVMFFGTDEELPKVSILRAGALSAEFDMGNLRHIRINGVEIIRAISFIIRDRDWGTYNPIFTGIEIEESDGAFTASYRATVEDGQQGLSYRAVIKANQGRLSFQVQAEATTDFVTNRTGFVVLHPIAGVAGAPVEVEQVDGCIVQSHFPELINPVQPMMSLRALTHEAAPGLHVTCRMEGDTFEMEDQRNWTDASYKTYVRPLALPWPYTLDAGTTLEQAVTLTVSGDGASIPKTPAAITLTLGETCGTAPDVGIGFDPANWETTLAATDLLAAAAPRYLVVHHDPRRQHNEATLRNAVALGRSLGTKLWLEAVVVSIDEFEHELMQLGTVVQALGNPFTTVLLSPAPDLKCTLPGSIWPDTPPSQALFDVARRIFPGCRIGGGMFSYFTELNRKRPATDCIDLVSFTTSAIVHAADDLSVMEGLESLPAVAASAKVIAKGLPVSVGPSAIGMRMNPYGAAPMQNPGNKRQAMNDSDPRQRGLLGASWALGYYAHLARGGIATIAFGGTTGTQGLVHADSGWPAPWYDAHYGVYPVFHVVRGLAAQSGETLLSLEISVPAKVQGVAFDGANGRRLWLANLTAQPQDVKLPTLPIGVSMLDTANFIRASLAPDLLERLEPAHSDMLTLPPYAVAHVHLSS